MNKKSSYHKLSHFSLFVMISVIVLISVIMSTVTFALYKNAEMDELQSVGDIFISCIKEDYRTSSDLKSDTAKLVHKQFSDKYNLKIYIYDGEGNCVLSRADYKKDIVTEKLSQKTMKELDSKDFLDFDTSNISENEPYILYGTKFFVTAEGSVIPRRMYALIYEKTDKINSFSIIVTFFYSLFAILGIIISYILLMRRVKKLAAYESDFHKVCSMYAKGDFSLKIPTNVPGTNQEIAKYVNAMAANVENSEETSKTFISNVSHELRTPMTTIGGFVDGILDGTIPKERRNDYLVLISKEIKRLRILINSMLNMSRFESGTMSPNFKETNLTDLVIQTVLMFEKRIDEKHLDIEGLGSERIVAVADADLMQQVIYNLVENAVKFVNEGGTLTFRFGKTDGICTIGIKNTGEGLKNDEIQQVFDRFYKTDTSRGKDATGLGLGLFISRKIVHLHDGNIVVKSVHGEYTEFLVQIPETRKDLASKKG